MVNNPIITFKTGTYSVTRLAAGSYTQGRYTAGGPTVISVDASIQPANGKQLLSLPEARRTENIAIAYSATELRVEDIMSILGEDYEVFKVARWDFRGTVHYESYMARRGRP